jgi:hypothetical protein
MTQPISTHSTDSERTRNQWDDERKLDDADDGSFEDPRIARERAEERERTGARDGVQADGHAYGTSYLGGTNTEEPWQQWRHIQSDFVDNPRSAVSNAHGLVGELIENIVRKFEQERTELEQRWSSGEDVGTEELRRCLQTYRDFFGRLLATEGKSN